MALTERRLAGPQAISNFTTTTVYTCPTVQTTTTLVKQIIFTNTASAEAKTIYLNLVPQGSVATNSNQIFAGISIPASETIIVDTSLVMESGDYLSIYSQGSNASLLNITISGVESAGGIVISGLADSAVTTAKIADSNITAAKLGPNVLLGNNQAGAIITMEMM